MKRKIINPREGWEKKMIENHFTWHSVGGKYWDESACYEFTSDEIDTLEDATNELHSMCINAVQYVIDNDLFYLFKINPEFIPHIIDSWNRDTPTIYGRFDFSYDGINPPKMLEFNADTPTSLYEASIIQWDWLEDFNKDYDQFNSIHEKLIEQWKYNKGRLNDGLLYFTSIKHNDEDLVTTAYLQDTATQSGIDTSFISLEDIGWDDETKRFVDLDNNDISNIFKLYPWEWLTNEDFGKNILVDNECIWIEPSWKMILSNKAILPILWEMYPDHKNLLPAFFEHKEMVGDYVIKPILSREGANVTIIKNGEVYLKSDGEYGDEGIIKQQLCELPCFDGKYPVIGSWVVGGDSAGIGIRESSNLITDNLSQFVPHYFINKQ